MEFKTDDGKFMFERAQDVLVDTTDGHLSHMRGVEYVGGANSGLLEAISGGDDDSVDRDEVGSRLLSELSGMHSIILDYTIHDEDREYVLERLEKTTGKVAKLSDEFAMRDQTYADNYHDDVVSICQAIIDETR